ncbi:hypothetical protein BC828DRAFT_379237 [Blastocladiella britannica]|nr:hypothetical protein BC828DRAFT_379237 [Blastocladiella britannica]
MDTEPLVDSTSALTPQEPEPELEMEMEMENVGGDNSAPPLQSQDPVVDAEMEFQDPAADPITTEQEDESAADHEQEPSPTSMEMLATESSAPELHPERQPATDAEIDFAEVDANAAQRPQTPGRLINKPYMGGLRDKRTGALFLHAVTQTPTPMEKRALLQGVKFHRDVQTKFVRHRVIQSVRESGTQMPRSDLALTDKMHKVIHAKEYTSADERHDFLVANVIVLQCFFRKIKAIRRVKRVRQARERKRLADEAVERRQTELTERQRRREIERRVHPRTVKDFALLYSGLETWRAQETRKIKQNIGMDADEKQAQVNELLNQEATLIQQLEALKVEAQEEAKQRSTNHWIDRMAGSKKWPLERGGFALVDTPTTLRARELRDLYCTLGLFASPVTMNEYGASSVDARLHALLQVKNVVKEFDCPLSREIIQLINREGDLLCRGRDGPCLDGLRQRILSLFLQFMSVPEFNPEAGITPYPKGAAGMQKATQSAQQSPHVYICKSCNKYLASTKFHLSTMVENVGVCSSCMAQQNAGSKRQSGDEYVRILAAARLSESGLSGTVVPKQLARPIDAAKAMRAAMRKSADSLAASRASLAASTDDTAAHVEAAAIAAAASAAALAQEVKDGGSTLETMDRILQSNKHSAADPVLPVHYMTEDDVAHLVQVIWNGHSAVSGNRHLSQLVLSRWELAKPLSPWNAILLTADEAHTHATVPLSRLYANEFVNKVLAKLALARRKWVRLAELESILDETPDLRSRLASDAHNTLPPISLKATVGKGIGIVASR